MAHKQQITSCCVQQTPRVLSRPPTHFVSWSGLIPFPEVKRAFVFSVRVTQCRAHMFVRLTLLDVLLSRKLLTDVCSALSVAPRHTGIYYPTPETFPPFRTNILSAHFYVHLINEKTTHYRLAYSWVLKLDTQLWKCTCCCTKLQSLFDVWR